MQTRGETFDARGQKPSRLPLCLQVDYLMSRLTSLEGRIGGTEDQLNIEMDHR